MITVDSIQVVDYTMLVKGNGGEEQLVIIASSGQDMKVRLMIIAATVDGGLRELLPSSVISIIANTEMLCFVLAETVRHWPENGKLAEDSVQEIVNKFIEMQGL